MIIKIENISTNFKLFKKRDRSDSGHVSVRDDEEGHLIYLNGDILQARCKLENNL